MHALLATLNHLFILSSLCHQHHHHHRYHHHHYQQGRHSQGECLAIQQLALSFMHVESSVVLATPEGGVLQISIDGEDRRIFWRLKPLILEFFGLKFGLIYVGFLVYSEQSEDGLDNFR